jgi:DNA-binding transcriptional ArsR family regulator
LLNGKIVLSQKRALEMSNYEKTEKLLKALASKSRLQVLECIQKGVTNPGDMAKRLKRHRSTIEKHLRVLLEAKLVEKVPSLSTGGHLTMRYKIKDSANEILTAIQDVSKKF